MRPRLFWPKHRRMPFGAEAKAAIRSASDRAVSETADRYQHLAAELDRGAAHARIAAQRLSAGEAAMAWPTLREGESSTDQMRECGLNRRVVNAPARRTRRC
ncbi:MAG: hypothetical protein HC801_05120 [Nitrospira sp.]|nr:hypothetical protein [Nitrospira sp.]